MRNVSFFTPLAQFVCNDIDLGQFTSLEFLAWELKAELSELNTDSFGYKDIHGC